ncbi:MAG: hypothetical protein RIS62_82 [Chloroflexota bacterium]|jgi:hypothetical protein|nr:hypothetical protein [Candidatus Aquidulcis sp.]
MKRLVALLLAVSAASGLVACSAAAEPTGTPLYTITRSWSNGMEEKALVYPDGRTIMTHGEYSEKVTLPADQMAALAAAAALEIPAGANSDDPILGVSIGDAAPVRPAGLTKDSLPELLNRLLDSHTLHP